MRKEEEVKKKRPMTLKMRRFADFYFDTKNGTRSYAQAYGYDIDSEAGKERNYNSVSTNASKLLQDERIQEYLEVKELEVNYERDLSEKEIVMLLNKIALSMHYKENTRLEAIKMLTRIKKMYEEEERNTAININLSSDLQKMLDDEQ